MAMVGLDDGSLHTSGLTAQAGWLGLRVGGCLALSLNSSNEPSELLQWPCHDERTINIGISIIIVIIIIIMTN